jgi:hypothetical protein
VPRGDGRNKAPGAWGGIGATAATAGLLADGLTCTELPGRKDFAKHIDITTGDAADGSSAVSFWGG